MYPRAELWTLAWPLGIPRGEPCKNLETPWFGKEPPSALISQLGTQFLGSRLALVTCKLGAQPPERVLFSSPPGVPLPGAPQALPFGVLLPQVLSLVTALSRWSGR